MIPKEVVEKIIETAQVEEVVSDFVNLKKRGVNYLGLCPFHNEKTPSFTVSPTKGIYKCFGCGRGGNSVNFLMEHEHYSYPEALRFLAGKYGIEVPEEELTDEQKEEHSQRESIYIVLNYAENYFKKQLLESERGRLVGLSYLRERGISDEMMERFGLGYSHEGWQVFTQDAIKAGYSEEYLIASGMTIKRDNGDFIDRFHGRVMFPIHSLSGRTLGFGGRILKSGDKKTAKYLNSPDTEVYNKSEVLYGLYQAKREIKKEEICFLVEGYTDVIALHQKGIENVVAASGTSLTVGHLQLVKRYCNKICFLFDGDQAGIKASIRAIDMALEEGLDVYALALPEGEDPDSFSSSHDRQEIHDYLTQERKDFIIFKTELLLPEAGEDPLKKAEVIGGIMNSVALIPDQLKRSLYVNKCARLLEMDEKVLLTELNKALSRQLKRKEKRFKEEVPIAPEQPMEAPASGLKEEVDRLSIQEEALVRFMLHFGNLMYDEEEMETVAEHIVNFIEDTGAKPENELVGMLFEEYRSHLEQWGVADLSAFYQHDNQEVRDLVINLTEEKYRASENWIRRIGVEVKPEDHYRDSLRRAINRYKLYRLQRLLEESMKEVKEGSGEEVNISLKSYKKLMEMRTEIARKLGIVVFS